MKQYDQLADSSGGSLKSTAECMDCGKPYEQFNMDLVLPRSQWLEINPEENGLLCAQCIVNRASKLRGAIVIHAVIEIAERDEEIQRLLFVLQEVANGQKAELKGQFISRVRTLAKKALDKFIKPHNQ